VDVVEVLRVQGSMEEAWVLSTDHGDLAVLPGRWGLPPDDPPRRLTVVRGRATGWGMAVAEGVMESVALEVPGARMGGALGKFGLAWLGSTDIAPADDPAECMAVRLATARGVWFAD